ncbi:hypothetical protein PUNSTDRAFT_140270 [Punctularia strigosozonata HHB-11173 SS5]|uniref:uncharacterized protein n=1 Tax=Punctularia strigosozonata (strain HHB-11173) TaxID=741275 RepID=UPI0004416A29|nr:uncharacterized protein PUNSTDRAFT_140270 [Punctularia strigosozonata HHB-11173 SS5]EIN13820.1 hypothetical protein PUNSTDRAFT_140270 [Punctularia strigosozonata HHB-11173 SS5]
MHAPSAIAEVLSQALPPIVITSSSRPTTPSLSYERLETTTSAADATAPSSIQLDSPSATPQAVLSRLPSPPHSPSPPPRRPLQMRSTPSLQDLPNAPAWSLRATDANSNALALVTVQRPPTRPTSPVPSIRQLEVSPQLIVMPISRAAGSLALSPSMTASSPPSMPGAMSAYAMDPPTPRLSPVPSPRSRRGHAAPLPDLDLRAMIPQPQVLIAQAVVQLVNVADPAWMLKVVVALVGWFAVLVTGSNDLQRRRQTRLLAPA